jgi:GT2 family glycosyltransferase/glycosyltransferase involved in cell wall biosynthesis
MRILVVSHGFPPHAQGGAEIYAHEHALAFARAGDKVLVVTRESNPAREEYSVREERRHGLTIAWVNNTFSRTTSFADTYRNDGVRRVVAPIIEGFAPDVAHVHHLTCLSTEIVRDLAAIGIPVFFTLHDYWLICHRGQLLDRQFNVCGGPEPSGCGACLGTAAGVGAGVYAAKSVLTSVERALPSAVTRPLRAAGALVVGLQAGENREREESAARMAHMRDLAAHVTHFFAPSRFMRDRFIAFGIDPARITVSEYGRAVTPISRQRRAASAPLRLGFLGSLMVSKAPHLLLEAAAGLPPGSVSIELFGEPVDYHGDTSYRERLAPLLSQPHVQVRGRIAHDDVARTLSNLDVLVVPSIWPENSPLVIREAFLASVPVVASRIGGIPETVTDGVNGLLFTPGDGADLRRTLQRLLSDSALLETLRQGIPPVRTLEDDVDAMRKAYADATELRTPRRRLAAVVLNYRTADDTFLAVRSLLLSSHPPDDLIVVDNDATDDCRIALKSIGDRVSFIASGINRGFSGGMNLGIREALARGAERVLLVNSDVILPHDALETLNSELDRHRTAGIAGPVVLARHAPDSVATMGMDYSKTTGRMRHRSVGDRFAGTSSGADTVDGVSGCVMLVRREVFTAIGLLDEDYFFGFEDLDFCLRARASGFATILARNSAVLHEGGKSIGAGSPRRLYFGARNQLLVARRTDRARGRLQSAARAGFIVALNLAHAVRSRGATLPARIAAVGRGSLDYWRGRFGPGDPGTGAAVHPRKPD